MHGALADLHRHVPMRLAAEPYDVQLFRAVPVGRRRGRRVVGERRARHVLPQEVLEGAHIARVDRVLRQHDHAVLPREQPEAVSVIAAADLAVVVEVEAAGHAGVDRCGVRIRIVDRAGAVLADLQVVLPEQIDCLIAVDVVELVQQNDVGVRPLDDLGDGLGLRVVGRRQVVDKLALGSAIEAEVVRRHAQIGALLGSWRCGNGGAGGDEG